MLTLGEELLLVALDADKGVIRRSAAMQIGLNAAGMAETVAAGWLQLRRADGSPGVTVFEHDAGGAGGAGDAGGAGGGGGADGEALAAEQPLLGQVLDQARRSKDRDRHPELCLKNWFSPSPFAYLKSLRDREVITWDSPKGSALYGRLHLLDAAAADSARARVERVATGAGPSERDLDLAGIVHGIRLDAVLYAGWRNRSRRAALAAALERHRFAVMLGRVLPEIPGQKVTFESSNDLRMAKDALTAWDRTP